MKTRLTSLLIIIAAFVGFALGGVQSVYAVTTITVQSTGDDGTAKAANCPVIATGRRGGAGCRLRDALAVATPGDTITFSALFSTLPVKTITLRSDALVVDKNVTISGPGVTKLSISGLVSKTPVLKILNPGGQGIVKISGVSIQFGNGTDTGGIFIGEGSSLQLENSNVSNNHSELGGGGILNLGSLVLIACNVNGNTNSFDSTRGSGGGIVTGVGSSSRLQKSYVTENTTGFGSGGILNHGSLELIDSHVERNTNSNGPTGTDIRLSGGITNEGSAHISGASTINNNTGVRGGGIENLGELTICSQ